MKKGGVQLSYIGRSLQTLLLFELLYRLFTRYALFPCLRWLFYNCLNLAKVTYLGVENLGRYLTSPIMLACTLLLFFVYTVTAAWEISCVIICMHSCRTDIATLGIFQLIYEGLKNALRLLWPKNWPLLLCTAWLIPLLQLPTSTSMLRLIHLPWNVIAQMAFEPPWCFIVGGYAVSLIALFALCPGACHYFVLERLNAYPAIARAAQAERGRRLHHTALFLLATLGACVAVYGGLTLLSRLISRGAAAISADVNFRYRLRLPFDAVFNYLKACMPMLAGLICLSIFYYDNKDKAAEPLPRLSLPILRDANRYNAITSYIALGVTLLAILTYDTLVRPTLIRLDAFDYLVDQPTKVIAHRGYSAQTDENTLSAFQAAIEVGVDLIELDVQQTADGVVVVHHDNSLYRVFGDRRRIWEVDWAELQALSAPLSGECPPTLAEVLTQCDPQAMFLVELKDNRHNPDLAQATWQVIDDCEAHDRCVIQSSSLKMLRSYKERSPDARCGYILSFALGSYPNLKPVDFFSIDADFVDASVLSKIHALGKQLYVWTVNDAAKVRDLLALGCDGIITDDAPMVKNTLLDIRSSLLDNLIAQSLESAIPLDADESP